MENYNGFKNWQTYLTDLHCEEKGYYNELRDFLREEPEGEIASIEAIASTIKKHWSDYYDETDTEIDLFNSFISWSLKEVDWISLAKKLKEGV